MFKKNCYHCINIRPRKGNLCVVLRKKIEDVNSYSCNNFRVDLVIQRIEEKMLSEQSDDDGSSWLSRLFGLSLKPIFI
jgi:hypothetical protein